MLPSTKPSAPLAVKEIGTRGPNEQWAPVESPPMMAKSNGAEPHRTDWADAKGQLDYFVSAGFNNDSIYRTAITPGGTFVSISPMRSSGRHANADMAKPAGKRTYPSQELNSRYQDLQLSPPRSEGGEKPPPLPPPVLPPWAQAPAGEYCVEKVPSMAPEPSRGHEGKFLPEKVASMAHGQRGNNGGKYHLQEVTSGLTQGFDDLSHNSSGHVLDSFDIDGVGSDSIAAGNLKSEALDGFSRSKHLPAPKRVSTSPSPGSKHSEVSATRLLKRMKGKPKSAAVGIMHPSPLDILRGRGGLVSTVYLLPRHHAATCYHHIILIPFLFPRH